jgi:cell wall-associated NlpC family hydrolase
MSVPLGDPLTDQRAVDLLAAIPDDVSTLAGTFRAAAGEAAMTATGLSAAREDGVWTGHAADGFRRSIGRLPAQLQRVQAGYAAVAGALDAYEPELVRLQSAFVRVIALLTDARTDLGAAQSTAAAARSAFAAIQRPPHPGRSALAEAELSMARAQLGVRGFDDEIERLTLSAYALLDEFAMARQTCRAAVAAAQRTAPVDPNPAVGAAPAMPGGAMAAPPGARLRLTFPVGSSPATVGAAPAEQRIRSMIDRADALLGTPYASGGGHGSWTAGDGLDCSGFVSAVLRSGGYLHAPVTTEGFAGQPDIGAGPGRFVTIYDRTNCGANEHVIIDLNGRFYESGGGSASGGAPFVHQFTPSAEYLASFNTVLHPVGL